MALPRTLGFLLLIPLGTLLPAQQPDPAERPRVLPGLEPDDEADMNQRVTPVVKAVRRAADSVVSIYLGNPVRNMRTGQAGFAAEGQGSGVVLDEQGLVITNWHVVALAEARGGMQIQVRTKSGHSHPAELLSTSPEDDLALLQVRLPADEKMKPVPLGQSRNLEVGETVIAIGNPQGHANTVTAGVLSATDRQITVRTPDGAVRRFSGLLQTDAAINQGNSGGALLDLTGRLVGINNAMAVGAENIGFAIPVDTVLRVFRDKLLSSESLAHVWLGLKVEDREDGLVVAAVDRYGPAHDAGIREGDRLVAIADQPVRRTLDYARRIMDAQAGRALPLQLARGSRRFEVEAVPVAAANVELLRRLGIRVQIVRPEQDRDLLIRATQEFYAGSGYRQVPILQLVLQITRVQEESPAAEIGLAPGDVLYGVSVPHPFGGRRQLAISSLDDFNDLVRDLRGNRLTAYVLRQNRSLEADLWPR